MVIVRLIGGLGNQMFQYATARAIAHRNGVPLRLDISGFESYDRHAYSLHHLSIQEALASEAEIERIKTAHRRSPVARLSWRLRRLRRFSRNTVVVERHFHFDPGILSLRGNVYLDGHWQSPRYFQDSEAVIRRELKVRIPPDEYNQQVARQILQTEAVSLHIRRGDYVWDTSAQDAHGCCTLDYYQAAVARLVELGVEPHFFVFSDDPAWAQQHLKLTHPTTYVTENGAERNFEDLRLMSLCHHHVIANSSFSWWGAWLGEHPQKRVFAPRRWFNQAGHDTTDLIPDAWVRL
jgi:hypothetical protein